MFCPILTGNPTASFETHVVLITSMAGRTVKALHGITEHKVEKLFLVNFSPERWGGSPPFSFDEHECWTFHSSYAKVLPYVPCKTLPKIPTVFVRSVNSGKRW
jgi:hypothetical protein